MKGQARKDNAFIKTMADDPNFNKLASGFVSYKGFNIMNCARGPHGVASANVWTISRGTDLCGAVSLEECIRRIDANDFSGPKVNLIGLITALAITAIPIAPIAFLLF